MRAMRAELLIADAAGGEVSARGVRKVGHHLVIFEESIRGVLQPILAD
ncbi:hypothetical protein C9F11_34940 [Streptomyces sp. YIM 121038]|nr:hypothetical protein [Streptomyces sp. YIM 121038]QCX80571.1 hypothetical protein C9F11_34940 [Streptomyces sp. YIM 121038]